VPPFAELAARSHYSFLEGSSSPRHMVQTAARLEIAALGLCDRNGLYGAVELIQSAKAEGIHPIIGTELELAGGSRLRLLARSRTGYRQLCRAVSAAQLAGVKGQPRLVIDVAFDRWTQAGRMRAPVYKGLRDDKDPAEVVREP